MQSGQVWVIDDDQEMLGLMTDYLRGVGYKVQSFADGSQAFKALDNLRAEGKTQEVDVIVSDIQMPEMDGLELVQRARALDHDLPVLLVTAFGRVETAIEATKLGAQDYMVKPFQLSEFNVRVAKAVALRRLRRDNSVLRAQVSGQQSHYEMIGRSKTMRDILELVGRVANATANVLITGESGSGKEVVARAIHERGPRSERPFIAINCTAIPESLLESELFGHAKGSFTGAATRKRGLFEEANGGTLFLDEIGDMELSLQAKLLRVIQERRIRAVGDTEFRDIDVRIICATHKDLAKAVKDGRFREDLYYRLSVIPIAIPPLRHRKLDIPALANHFLVRFAAVNHSGVRGFTPEAMDKLVNARWDGNVRELENLIERLVVLARGEWIRPEDIPFDERQTSEDFFAQSIADMPTMDHLEKRYIQFVLEKVGGRKEKAAHILGINRRTLYRKEREYNLVSDVGQDADLDQQHLGRAADHLEPGLQQ